MNTHLRGEAVPEPRSSKKQTIAVALVAATVAYGGVLDYHRAHDQTRPEDAHAKAALLDNVRSSPRPTRERASARLAYPHASDDLGAVEAALALVVLAAAKLPRGCAARRVLARDARALLARADQLRSAA